MKKISRIIALFMVVLMIFTMIPSYAMASLFDNSPEYNKEILSALKNVVGSDQEAEKYYSVMSQFGLLDDNGKLVENLHAEIDGKEYSNKELFELLSGDYDGNKIAIVDGTPIKLDDLWNIIVIENYINYLRETYNLDGEWTQESEENYSDFIDALQNNRFTLSLDPNENMLGEYSGVNHGAVVTFETSENVNNTVTVTAKLSAAAKNQVVTFDYETINGSAVAVKSNGSIKLVADKNGEDTKTFTVKSTAEDISTLISDSPVAYLNVKNLKNATFAASGRNAATIAFSGEPTVGKNKELDRIVGNFDARFNGDKYTSDRTPLFLSSGEKYAIKKHIVNTVSAGDMLHTAVSFHNQDVNYYHEYTFSYDKMTVSFSLYADNSKSSFFSNSWDIILKDNGMHEQKYMVYKVIKPANYVNSVSLDNINIEDNFYYQCTTNPPITGDYNDISNYFYFRDTTKPTVKSITVPDGEFTVGQTVPVTVEFSEPMSAGNTSVTVNGTTVKAQEKGASDRLTFPYPVKTIDSAHAVVTAVTGKDVSGNAIDSSYKPGSSGSLVLNNALIESCLAEDSLENITCEIDNKTQPTPVLNVSLKLSEDSELNEWLASDLDENGVSSTLFAAVKGFEKVPFTLKGDTFDGATMTASFSLTPVETDKQYSVELYKGEELMIGSLRYITQKAAPLIKAEDIKVGTVVTQANGDPYTYTNSESPVIYVQDSPVIRAMFSLEEKDYIYADTNLVTILDSDGNPVSSDAHFAWSSSDTSVANIDEAGKVIPTGKSGTVHFTLTAINGDKKKSVTVDTDDITFGVGLTPFLIIPNNEIKATSGNDVPLFWSSNIPDKDKKAIFSVIVKNSKGEEVYTQNTKTCGITLPGDVLTYNYNEGSDNTYIVTVSVSYENKTLTAEATISLESSPAVINLERPQSLYLTDTSKSIDIIWNIKNFDCYNSSENNLFRLYITKNDETVYESFNTPGKGENGNYTGTYTLDIPDVKTNKNDSTSYRDTYTVSIQAKNGSDSTWSYDSYVMYVYDEEALKIWVNGEEAGSSLTMTNIPEISKMNRDQILELKRDISLGNIISANYGDYAWTDLSDRISWSSSKSEVSDLNYRQGSYYSSINNYSYTSYRPATQFLLSGLSNGEAEITATHAFTGISDSLSVKVETLKDKLYLFSCTPATEITMHYTDGKGKEKTALSNEKGEFAIYEESGISGDVYFETTYEGYDYYGTYFSDSIRSGEADPSSLNLYPCNNLVMRRAAYASIYLKNADGTPYEGDLIVRGGVSVNGKYIPTAKFGYQSDKFATHEGNKDCRVKTDSTGKLSVVMDSTQWNLKEDLLYSDNVSYDFVVKKADSTDYYPLYIHVDASQNENSYIKSGEGIATFRKNAGVGEHPFVIDAKATTNNDKIGFSATQNILDNKGSIGVSQDITSEEISVSIMWWGIEANEKDTYSMSILTDDRYEISSDKKTVTSNGLPFAETAVTTITIPFDSAEAKKLGINEESKGLELRYANAQQAVSYSEQLSFRIADTTNVPLTSDAIISTVSGVKESFEPANTSGANSIELGDDIISLVMEHFSTTNYQPDKDHASGFNLTVMPTQDPTTFIAYIGLGFSNVSDENVTGVFTDGSSKENFSYLPGIKEFSYLFTGNPSGYINNNNERMLDVSKSKVLPSIYYNATGYLESKLTYNTHTRVWDIHVLSGGFDAGGGIGFVKYMNTAVGPVPVTAELRGGGMLNVSLDTLTMEYLNSAGEIKSGSEFLTQLRLFFYLKFFGGIGFDYSVVALKIGLYGQINADIIFEWLNRPSLPKNATYTDGKKILSDDKVMNGRHVSINGRIGIEFVAKFLFISYEKSLWSTNFPKDYNKGFAQWDDIDSIWKTSQEYYRNSLNSLLETGAATAKNYNGEEMIELNLMPTTENFDYLDSGVQRKWNENTLDKSLQGSSNETNTKKMQTNSNPFTSPKLSDDGKILVYLSDEAGDDGVHTAYAVRNEKGYTDKGIISGEGSTDTGNVIAGTDEFAVAAWASLTDAQAKDAGSVITAEDQIIMMESSEIYASVYEDGKWHTKALTNNTTADIAPVVAVSGNKAVAVWRNVSTTNLNGNIADFNANDTILYSIYENGSWSESRTLYNGTSGNIKALNTAMLPDGTISVIFTLDTDKVDLTTSDREIVWTLIDANGELSRTVRATSDDIADENPQIAATSIDGKPCFVAAWYSSFVEGEKLKYDIHMVDFTSDGVILGRLPQSSEKLIEEQDLLITSDFRFSKGSESIEDLALVWVERADIEGEDGKTIADEYDILNSIKFYVSDDEESRISLTGAQMLAKAPASTLIDSFDTVTLNNEAIPVFLGTSYNPDKVEEKIGETENGTTVSYLVPLSTSNIYTAMGNFKDGVSVKHVYAEPDSLRCGATTSVAFTVSNDGINPIESLTVKLGDTSTAVNDLNILPGDTYTVYVDYKVPMDSVRNEKYTVTAKTSNGNVYAKDLAQLAVYKPEITSASIAEENEGKRTIDIKLNNASDAKLATNGKAVALRFYSDPSCENKISELPEILINDAESLNMIDNGGFSKQVIFDVRNYLDKSEEAVSEIPENGIAIYIRADVIDNESKDADSLVESSVKSVICDNLLSRTGSKATIRTDLKTQNNISSLSVKIRNNSLSEVTCGNVIATLFDQNGNIVEQKQSYTGEGGENSLLTLKGEETKRVDFTFERSGSYAQVMYTQLILDDKSDATLSKFESTDFAGLNLSSFTESKKNTYTASIDAGLAESINIIFSASDPDATVTLNGIPVDGFVTEKLTDGINTFDFAVVSCDKSNVIHYILTVNKEKAADDDNDDVDDDRYCTNPVSGICLTYNKYIDVPLLGILFKFIHRIVHIFHGDF